MKPVLIAIFSINFIGCVLANLSVLMKILRHGKAGSMIPLIKGITGAVAVYLLPRPFNGWWALALILDVSWALYAAAAFKWAKAKIQWREMKSVSTSMESIDRVCHGCGSGATCGSWRGRDFTRFPLRSLHLSLVAKRRTSNKSSYQTPW